MRRNRNVRIEFAQDSREILATLDSDVQALVGMVDELVATHTAILETIRGDIIAKVSQAVGIEADDLAVEINGGVTLEEVEQPVSLVAQTSRPPLPEAMNQEGQYDSDVSDANRVRATPFTRAPRSTQIEWLREYMASGDWFSAVVIARDVANDERHYRYMRHAIGGRFREMHEDGEVERRDSHVKGAMFEYRLIPAKTS